MKTSAELFNDLLTELYKDLPPEIHAPLAEPCDLDSCSEWLRDFAAKVDTFLLAFGHYISDTVKGGLSEKQMAMFKRQLIGAIEGNATHEIEKEADNVREEIFQNSRRARNTLVLMAPHRIQ